MADTLRTFEFDDHFFERTDDPAVAYFAGLMVADGNVQHKPYTTNITLSLQESDTPHLRLFADALGVPGTFDPISPKGSCRHLRLRSPHLRAGLDSWGLIPNKTYELRSIPSLWSQPEVTPHFIRGLWDGDGSIRYDDKRSVTIAMSIGCSSWIVDWIAGVLDSRGVVLNRRDRTPRPLGDGEEFVFSTISVSGYGAILDTLSWLGYYDESNISLERKREKAVRIREWVSR